MEMPLIVGIDPGFKGAIALYSPVGGLIHVADMPLGKETNGRDVVDYKELFDLLDPQGKRVQAFLERVASRPGQSAPATFRFGEGYGALQMALLAHGYDLQRPTPAAWKKHFGLSSDKGVSRSYARERFPAHAHLFSRVKDDGRAEAALIALYGAEKLKKA